MNKVEICGVNTSKLPTLSKAEKNELFVKIKQGDLDARDKFVNGNLRLVLSVIQRFNNRGENSDDLFQVGCIGLIKAIDNFDLSQNVQFSTYAVPMNVSWRKNYIFNSTFTVLPVIITLLTSVLTIVCFSFCVIVSSLKKFIIYPFAYRKY